MFQEWLQPYAMVLCVLSIERECGQHSNGHRALEGLCIEVV
jgi:hypothetical protein